MIANVSTEEFRDALGKILSVIDRKNSRPILTLNLLIAKNRQLELIATDLEVSVKIIISANVENDGVFCVNTKNIFDIIREFPDNSIQLESNIEEKVLKISGNNIQYSLLINSSNDFPVINFENSKNGFTVNTDQLSEIINRTSHAISIDETRPALTGLFIQEIDSKLRAVATDGCRLSLIEAEITETNNDSLINGIIIPRKGVFELKKITDSFRNETINISIDDSFLYTNVLNKYFISIRLIARDFPKYQTLIPSKTAHGLIVDKISLLNAIKRVKIMSNEKINGVILKFWNNEMVISANHPLYGKASEKVSVEYNGEETEIGFNAKYLMETITTYEDGDISVEFNNKLTPFLVRSASLPHFLSIVMPLKIQ
ncbi:MAG: DNA polymerase III subunit beta [Bdellovibrionales bacterium RIFOXYD12_FULL_39_22]|nr:MAG: DNA polymerase III subunit beta [Bdellovibrionales bacterium RIFOXYB1_FULL_39_21]OFZ45203.1 MAG: DNA polymerase III subunit beta [Bdellovibrionales bacterium RIFOXYC12_FULL_39_17]OFZ45604.1 MAG: DNA polymerase III subunit beta [Bdellovibrionales bacterium RIFOXYC1_FULL_39_130]OFZ77466.1 MAG: DNA polymerase III subunit beta [Bdellovibrionales bacterium RIFOXYD1_FULL_39_84]OFZ91595.1 MAG: DNA polymerase III subunit beta [Bdellovibrionales bacterium RIFOXYD12_FULL_39_22]HLE11944.1 DNA pol